MGGSFTNEGRVEIFYGIWGSVCQDSWDLQDAIVVCRQLGWVQTVSYRGLWFGLGTGRFWLENANINCIGNESKLYQCPQQVIRSGVCRSRRYANVQCTGSYICY